VRSFFASGRAATAAVMARDVVVDLVVLLLAQAGRKPDLEDEELADELGRIEVIGQTLAVGFKRRPPTSRQSL
jgi:hypothetical protein